MRNTLRNVIALVALAFPLQSLAQHGELDPSFGTNGITETTLGIYAEEKVNDILLLPNGQILVASTRYINASYAFLVQRFNSDGSMDPTFAGMGSFVFDTEVIADYLMAMALQPDGKVILFGYSETSPKFSMTAVRIDSDGFPDPSFGDNGVVSVAVSGSDTYGNDVAVQANGKIILAGYGSVAGTDAFKIARLNTNGTLDGSFGSSGIVSTLTAGISSAYTIVEIQSEGKIVLAGTRQISPTQQEFCVMRLNTDGSYDTDFSGDGTQLVTVEASYNQQRPYGMAIQPDGKIVLAGVAGYVQNSATTFIRLNTDGEPDAGFANSGIRITSFVLGDNVLTDVLIQPDGVILACGYTIDLDGLEDWILTRVDTDGNPDATFGTGTLVNTDFTGGHARAQALAMQPDGKILAAGRSVDNAGDRYTGLARYESGVDVGVNETTAKSTISIYPNPSADVFHITLPSDVRNENLILRNALGQTLLSTRVSGTQIQIDLSNFADGVYFLSLDGEAASPTKLVKQSR
ncbi:MAG: T9SS type A sorting domain-containing protein [Flavobacteriales bacterium]|nr:T9SS type A sorting domain-containing protein [Flavobacteriales bacterium]